MSFRIDLTAKDDINIFLVVVRNQININFKSNGDSDVDKHKTSEMKICFNDLLNCVKLKHRANIIRGANPEHIKRHHVTFEETNIPHLHVGFDIDVTPEILKDFFDQVARFQKMYSNEQKYQFFDLKTIKSTIQVFSEYYKEFLGSEQQKQFLQERKLTPSEKESLAHFSHLLFTNKLSKSDKIELKNCVIQSAPHG